MTHTIPQAARRLVAGVAVALAASTACGVHADGLRAPMGSRNLSPLFVNLGVPPARDAVGLGGGEWRLAAVLHWASHAVRERGANRRLELDGETQRLDLNLRLGIGRGFTLDLNLPWLRHSGGSLDGAIDGWHGFWGLPDGPRADQPRDRLRFAYTGEGGFLLDDGKAGIGDVEAAVEKRVAGSDNWAISAFAHVKLATGEREDFTGSGETSLGAGLRVSADRCAFDSVSCHLQAGVMDVGELRQAPVQNSRIAFAGLSIVWAIRPALALLAQIDTHGNVYERAPLDTSGDPVWGTLGLRWQPAGAWHVEGAFSEDLAVGSAPDITFLLRVARDI